MVNNKGIAVVLPAYNAEKTLEATIRELPDLVDFRILVDDHTCDQTVEIARMLGLQYFVHDRPTDANTAARHRYGQHGGVWCL